MIGPGAGRTFLFLQGPHGPFFAGLARRLKDAGAQALKVGLSRADEREWAGAGPWQPFTGPMADWPGFLGALVEERGVTDIVLYGDERPAHRAAAGLAGARGLRLHVFEEGYLRPHWITYERGGANGRSRLMELSVARMAEASRIAACDGEAAPPIWGAAWRHAALGFRHHFDILFRNGAYPHFEPHRPTGAARELGFYLRRLLVLPLLGPERRWRERRLLAGGRLYHLVLLQMAGDSSLRAHGPFGSVSAFVAHVLEAFATGAPRDHLLVFKTHPFEDGRERLEAKAREAARMLGVERRIVFLHGGRLGPLLDRARSAVTVNSTAGQQALWRGLPLHAAGRAVYSKPEFVDERPLAAFFRRPAPPDAVAYREYRQFLLMSSQLRGSYYTAAGRRAATEAAAEKMLDPLDPYDRVFAAAAQRDDLAPFPRAARNAGSGAGRP